MEDISERLATKHKSRLRGNVYLFAAVAWNKKKKRDIEIAHALNNL